MNNLFGNNNSFKEYLEKEQEKMMQQQEKADREALKTVFKDKIKVSFMFKVLKQIQKITNYYNDILKYYPGFFRIDPISTLMSTENVELDLCCHIVGIHTFNMLLTEEHERGTKQQSQKYIEEVANTVLEQVKVRQYGSMLFRKRKIFGNEDFLYYPTVYNLHVLLVYLITISNKIHNTDKTIVDGDVKRNTLNYYLANILGKSRAVLSVIDYDALDSGYPILRNIIEMYLTYLAFNYSNADIVEYMKFNDYKVHFDAEFKLPEEFEKEYLKNGKDVNKIAYLNYGWLDSIFEFEYLGIKKSYNFSDVVKLVNQLIYKDRKIKNYAFNLEVYYKKCHYHSHANLYGFRFPIIYIMDLCKGLGEVLLGIAYEINKIEKVDLFNGVDLVKAARLSVDRLHKIREELTTEKLERYYKNRN